MRERAVLSRQTLDELVDASQVTLRATRGERRETRCADLLATARAEHAVLERLQLELVERLRRHPADTGASADLLVVNDALAISRQAAAMVPGPERRRRWRR